MAFEEECLAETFQNKFRKSGMFLDRKKHHAKHHDLTTNPPQPHHDLPSKNTLKSAKLPAKLPFDLSKIFSPSAARKLVETCNYP
jgi:hypothetical protein